ncbi:hypothetical protein [Prochlorothrix hollandica]|uniref:hypothetical protein n=1 Tax=Prochlorothrix hollandica TaxID=1223 RepID=UPI00333E9A96
MSYWVKLQDGRDIYVVDLEQVSAFTCIEHGRVSFHLPGNSQEIVLTTKANPQAYRLVLAYVRLLSDGTVPGYWLTLKYDRDILVFNLQALSCFCLGDSGKISFTLPHSNQGVVLRETTHGAMYHKVLRYVQQVTRDPMADSPPPDSAPGSSP